MQLCQSCTFVCERLCQTQRLAQILAQQRQRGHRLLLQGSVGSGKSEFSRAFIREAYEDETLHVPSPTYLLQHVYDDLEGAEIHHYDLYRVTSQQLQILELKASFEKAVTLIEWPERMTELRSDLDHLLLHFYLWEEAVQKWPELRDLDLPASSNRHSEMRFLKMCAYGPLHASLLSCLLHRFPHRYAAGVIRVEE